jgi:hypothetical protein
MRLRNLGRRAAADPKNGAPMLAFQAAVEWERVALI